MAKKSAQQQTATDESPARATDEVGSTHDEDMREEQAKAQHARIVLWRVGLYCPPIEKRQRKQARAHFLKVLAEDAQELTLEDLVTVYLVANLWKFFPATSPK